MNSPERHLWKEAINSEVKFILQNHTWKLVNITLGSKFLGYKWIFKRKIKIDGSINKYKVMSVIKGFGQKEGIDYFEIYSPVTRITSIRMMIAITTL